MIASLAGGGQTVAEPTCGPLRRHPDNPHWFADALGEAVYLSGSHTWANRQERGLEGETPDFDYQEYLDFLSHFGHNFIRLWAWEHSQWMQFVGSDVPVRYRPLPWPRTGPGLAQDGKPKFDVSRFDETYFARLRQRVRAARDRGIYVALMLFQGFSVEQKGTRGVDPAKGNPWDGHPFNAANNINGVDGDLNHDGEGTEVHTLADPEITRIQEAYVRRTIEEVGDLDNVLWEIGNECHPGSVEWQYHMIRFIRRCEADRSQQHLIGMTGAPIKNAPMLLSPADWISPIGKAFLDDPPLTDEKLIVVDTDHIRALREDPSWPWRCFMRGMHFILMDPYRDFRAGAPQRPDPAWNDTRRSMGLTVEWSRRINLAAMRPHSELASSGFCLADPGTEWLVYYPNGGECTLDLTAAEGAVEIQALHLADGDAPTQKLVLAPGARLWRVALSTPAVVHARCTRSTPN